MKLIHRGAPLLKKNMNCLVILVSRSAKVHTGWPVMHDRVFLISFIWRLVQSSCTIAYTRRPLFTWYQKYKPCLSGRVGDEQIFWRKIRTWNMTFYSILCCFMVLSLLFSTIKMSSYALVSVNFVFVSSCMVYINQAS